MGIPQCILNTFSNLQEMLVLEVPGYLLDSQEIERTARDLPSEGYLGNSPTVKISNCIKFVKTDL